MSNQNKKYSFKNWKKSIHIFKFLKPYKTIYGLGLICLLISSLTAMIFPYLLGNLLGANIEHQEKTFHLTDSGTVFLFDNFADRRWGFKEKA